MRLSRRIEAWARLRRRMHRRTSGPVVAKPAEMPSSGYEAFTAMPARPKRPPRTIVIMLDGTMSSLEPGRETNVGLTYKLLSALGPRADLALYYESGLQWPDWRKTGDIITGKGLNGQIQRAYAFLASRYRLGDKVFLLGFSRGAFAVRSLAGVIDRVGLVCSSCATERKLEEAYRHYRAHGEGPACESFRRLYGLRGAKIEMVGVWDTVKALGLRLPLLWRFSAPHHAFHNHHLGHVVQHGYQALALDETRQAFAPEMWDYQPDWAGHVEQMWFRGSHGDVGGQLNGALYARPLSNIPLTWMLGKAEGLGLPLPSGWREEFPVDPDAPSVGTLQGWGKLFLYRGRRVVGRDPSEQVHPSVAAADEVLSGLLPEPQEGLSDPAG